MLLRCNKPVRVGKPAHRLPSAEHVEQQKLSKYLDTNGEVANNNYPNKHEEQPEDKTKG